MCEYCNRQPETIHHLLVECEISKQFWNELKTWLSANSSVTLDLGEKNLLFAYQDKSNTIRNYLCILAKYFIYTTKFAQKNLLLENFINLLKKKFQSEKYIFLMNNSMTNFFAKWAPLYNHLNANVRQ